MRWQFFNFHQNKKVFVSKCQNFNKLILDSLIADALMLSKEKNMARFNHCCCNHPRPILCPFSLDCDSNQVVNPILDTQFGFFNNTTTNTVLAQDTIPVFLVQSSGTSITPSLTTNGAVNLLAGTYEVSYFANGTVPANGNFSIKLEIDGVEVSGSVLNATQTAGEVASLTQTMIITVNQTSTLELVNNSADTTVFTNASMAIRRL